MPNIARIAASRWRAGRASMRNRASPSPAFRTECSLRRGTSALCPTPKGLLLASDANCQRTFEHLDALVLANVYVQWDPATGIESHLELEELAVGVAAGLKDGYVLAGENVMHMITGGHEAQSRL